MCKIIFYVLIIVGLCFGQSIWLKENPKITLPMPINGTGGIAERKVSLYSSQNLSLIKFLGSNVLLMQVEGETLQPKTSFWKQAGIYGLEFVAGGIGTCASATLGACIWSMSPSYSAGYPYFLAGAGVYFVSNTLLTSSLTAIVGKKVKQPGSWKKAALGTALGSLINIAAINFPSGYLMIITFILPPVGGVVGYNWH